MVKILIWLTFVGMLVLHLLPWIGNSHLLELASHFRLHYAVWALLWWGLFALIRSRVGLAAIACLTLWNVWDLGRWYWPRPVSANAQPRLKILMSNLYYGNVELTRFQRLIDDFQPDLIVIEELNSPQERLMQALKNRYPYALSDVFSPAFGLGVWSRLPLEKSQLLFLGPAGIPSLDTRFQWQGKAVQLLATHPYPPINQVSFEMRNAQYKDLTTYLRQSSADVSQVLLGDLNITPWSPYYRQLESHSGLRNARYGFGILPTWPSHVPLGLGIPIDHVLVSDAWHVHSLRVGPDVGSDHLPMLVELSFP